VKKFVAAIEETPQNLILKIGERGHSAQQALLAPAIEKEAPEILPPAKIPFELSPSPVDFFDCCKQPDVLLARLAQDFPQQPDAILLRTPEAVPKVAHRHRLVPKEVRNRLFSREVRRQRDSSRGHGIVHPLIIVSFGVYRLNLPSVILAMCPNYKQ
jgi:hypothetical protein